MAEPNPYRGHFLANVPGDSGEEHHIPTSNVEHVPQHLYGLPPGYFLQPHQTQTLQHAGAGHPTSYSDIDHQPLHQSLLRHHSMSHPSPTSPYDPVGYQPQQSSSSNRKRSRPEDHLQLDLSHSQNQPLDPYGQSNIQVGHQQQGYTHPLQAYPPPAPPPSAAPQQHHHHHLPGPSRKRQHMEDAPSSPLHHQHGPPSVVGQEGMPPPAPRPRGPKLKFTPEDDGLLVDLKEKKNLTWKQIADFFPGRSSGTLQVRYCTKLKAKTTVWTDEMVQKLRNAMQEYENDRWRIISSKVGSGFSPTACRDKAQEIAAVEAEAEEEEEEEEQSGYTQAQLGPGSSDPVASFQ